jgi:feruloyl esterase
LTDPAGRLEYVSSHSQQPSFVFTISQISLPPEDFVPRGRLRMAFNFLCCFLAAFLLPFVAAAAAAATSFQARCLLFAPQKYIQNSTLNILSFVPKGTNLTFPDNDASCARPYQMVSVDLCRVALSIPTSHRSSITYELWLPSTWTGRILATGNGGIDGC